MAVYVMFLFKWLATAMDYIDSSLVAREKLCRLLLQSKDEAKWLPRHDFLMWVDPVQV